MVSLQAKMLKVIVKLTLIILKDLKSLLIS